MALLGNGLLAAISSGEVTVAAGTLAPSPEQPSAGGAIAPATGVGPRGGANGVAFYAAPALAALGLGLLGAGAFSIAWDRRRPSCANGVQEGDKC